MKIMIRWIWLYLSISSSVFGQDPKKLHANVEQLTPQQQELYKVLADELRCPTCTGLSVLQSDAPFSVEIKNAIVEQVQAGKKEKEILNFFNERFGLWILRSPPKEGFHWLAWFLPLGLILFSIVFIWVGFWRKKSAPLSLGLRKTEDILAQMADELASMRGKKL